MTVLAELLGGRVAIQCDVCIPPMLTVNDPAGLRSLGWRLAADGQPLDVCHLCGPRGLRTRRADAEPTEPDPARLPNLVIVGAMKAGTTSMHGYLDQHPEIAASEEKELRFFSDPDCRDWVGTYQAQWEPGTRYRLESTPHYSKWPAFPGVADRLAELVPDVRLLYLVRDPVDRIVAEYVEQLQWRAASSTIEEELAEPGDLLNWMVAGSRYATQLRELQRRIDADRIRVIDLDELAADPNKVLQGVCEFLGLEPVDFEAGVRLNTRDEKAAFQKWLVLLRRRPVVRLVRALPERPRAALSRAVWRFRTKVEAPELAPETVDRLREVLRPEVEELRALTGLPLAGWSL